MVPVSPRHALAKIVGGLSLDGAVVDSPAVAPGGVAQVGDQSTVDSIMRELVKSKKRIAELERALADKEEERSSHPETTKLELNIEEKRKTIAGLEAQRVVAKEELKVLEDAVKDGRVESSKLVDELCEELSSVKEALMQEIQDLLVQHDLLKVENDKLARSRDRAVEESSLLNIKNSQLADMNNALTQQIIDKFGPYAIPNSSGPGHSDGAALSRKDAKRKEAGYGLGLPSSAMASALALASQTAMVPPLSGDEPLSPPTAHSMEKSSSAHSTGSAGAGSGGASYSAGEEPMVTVLDQDSNKGRQHGRRFWKRPGAAVAKGLTRVFAAEEVGTGEYVDLSGGVPKEIQAGVKQSKSSRNGWFTNSKQHEINGSPIPASAPSPHKMPVGGTSSGGLMGTPIVQQCAQEGVKVPTIVSRCILEVESRGLNYEGLYRKSGGKSQIQSIIDAFEKSADSSYDEALSGDIAGVTSALKQYLRYLPIPLISYDVYDDFIKAGAAKDTEKMRAIIKSLPQAHQDTLEVVTRHLALVTKHSDANLMTARNMAVVFAPTLARDETGDREIIDMQPRNDGTQLLIENVESLF
jgi:hypothetical protein